MCNYVFTASSRIPCMRGDHLLFVKRMSFLHSVILMAYLSTHTFQYSLVLYCFVICFIPFLFDCSPFLYVIVRVRVMFTMRQKC